MAQMLIGHDEVAVVSGQTIEVINPATEEVVDTVPDAGPEDVEAAVTAAQPGCASPRAQVTTPSKSPISATWSRVLPFAVIDGAPP